MFVSCLLIRTSEIKENLHFFFSILIFVSKPKASVKLSNGISGVKTMCNDDSLSLKVVLWV